MDALNGMIAKLERRLELEKTRDRAAGELERAEGRLAPLVRDRGQAHAAAVRFNAALEGAYADRVAARSAIRAFAQREGVSATVHEIASHPERFGELRAMERGLIRSAERKDVHRRASDLSRAGDEYFRKVDVARGHASEYRTASRAVKQAQTSLRTMDERLDLGPGVEQLRLQIRERVSAFPPQRRQEVGLRLSPSQRLLLGTGLTFGAAFVREQGHER